VELIHLASFNMLIYRRNYISKVKLWSSSCCSSLTFLAASYYESLILKTLFVFITYTIYSEITLNFTYFSLLLKICSPMLTIFFPHLTNLFSFIIESDSVTTGVFHELASACLGFLIIPMALFCIFKFRRKWSPIWTSFCQKRYGSGSPYE